MSGQCSKDLKRKQCKREGKTWKDAKTVGGWWQFVAKELPRLATVTDKSVETGKIGDGELETEKGKQNCDGLLLLNLVC